MRRALVMALGALCFSGTLARADGPPPGARGFLILPSGATAPDDLRPGRIAGAFAERGFESVVANDCVRPPPDPEQALVHGRWRLDDARRARRAARWEIAVTAGDAAIASIERNAFERQHLDLLVAALIERGATALAARDPGTAETVFLKALALDPLHELDVDLFADMVPTFSEVRRASRELRFGSIRVEVPGVPEATVAIDFGSPQDAPVRVSLPDGRHFVSVTAPSRHEVVLFVPVRAERETLVTVRPPLSGDVGERATALAAVDARRPETIAELSRVIGLRFVVLTEATGSGIRLVLHDGASGQRVDGREVTISPEPGVDEIDAAVSQLVAAASLVAPELERGGAGAPRWYTSWWAIGLLGVAVAGAAAATYLVVSSNATTLYTFEP